MAIRAALFTLVSAALLPGLAASQANGPTDHAGRCPLSLTPAQAALARANQDAGLYDAPPIASRGGTTVVPITAHIVRRSNGTGGLSIADLDQSFADASAKYAAGNIELCVTDVLYIDDDFYFTDLSTVAEIDLLRTQGPVPGTLNIYFTPILNTEFGSICGISSFTFSDVQGIAVSNSCTAMTGNASTLAHEIGHYFDLFHTHESALGDECVNGSNCADAGDLVCDTPADPNVLGEVDSACDWFGTSNDPCGSGLEFQPPVLNLMSYSTKACRQVFTPEQFSRMNATMFNLRPELAQTVCANCSSPADVNGDRLLTPADFSAWITAFNTQDPAADQNADGDVTPSDFTAWIQNYNTGC